MIFSRIIAAAGLAVAGFAVRANADEHNVWPAYVGHADAEGRVQAWTGFGPLLFSHPVAPVGRVEGFRPFYTRRQGVGGDTPEITVLYPLFYIRNYGPNYEWSILKLINHFGRRSGESVRPATQEQDFDVWPFYFSSVTPDPADSYHALWPVAGTLQHRFSRDRISFVLWPLYLQTEKDGETTTSTPWPIFHTTHGAAQGWALWPLYGVGGLAPAPITRNSTSGRSAGTTRSSPRSTRRRAPLRRTKPASCPSTWLTAARRS